MKSRNHKIIISRVHESKNSAGLTDRVDPAIMGAKGKKTVLII